MYFLTHKYLMSEFWDWKMSDRNLWPLDAEHDSSNVPAMNITETFLYYGVILSGFVSIFVDQL